MKNAILKITAVCVAVALLAGGCRTTRKNANVEKAGPAADAQPAAPKADVKDPAPEQKPEAAKQDPNAKPPVAPEPGVAPEGKKPGAAEEELIKKYQESLTREEQEKKFLSEFHVRKARELLAARNLEEARKHAEEAARLDNGNLEAQALLRQIGDLSTRKPDRGYPEEQLGQLQRMIEQTELEVRNHIGKAESHYSGRNFDEAMREFESAEIKLEALPHFSELKVYLPNIKEKMERVRDAKKRNEEMETKMKISSAAAEAAEREAIAQKEMKLAMRDKLNLAYIYFSQRRFDKTARACDEILEIDPHYRVAKELREDALKAKHKDEWYNVTSAKIEGWKAMVESQEEAVIPYADKVRFPKADVWKEISKRDAGMNFAQAEGEEEEDEDVDILNINAALERTKMTFEYEDVNLHEMKTRLAFETGKNFVIDREVAAGAVAEKRIPFKLTNVSARVALKAFLQYLGLASKIENDAVVITTPEKAMGRGYSRVYTIADIIGIDGESVAATPFLGKDPSKVTTGRLTGLTQMIHDPKDTMAKTKINGEKLIDLLKKNIAPGTWDTKNGHTMLVTSNNHLVVNHVASVQKKVRQFLQTVRAYAGTIVSVEARFYTVDNNFLEDIGVDWRNLPRIDGDEILQDVDSAPGLRVSERAGASELYDLRAGTFHTWLRSATAANPWTGNIAGTIPGNELITPGDNDPGTGAGEAGTGGLVVSRESPLGTKLGDVGGIGLQYAWFGEGALNMVLRALSKREKSELLWAPQLTVFNGQRANIMVLKQWSYVQDYDAQTGTFMGVPDPKIGIVQDGAIFDVRPVVSHDRKYVTMELRPSLILLQGFRQRVVGGNPVQLPWVVYEKVETTVRCPDRGGLIVGGMRDIVMRDFESSTPILGEIPILNFFFSRKVKSDEKRRVLIVVVPEIIDLAEQEALQVQ